MSKFIFRQAVLIALTFAAVIMTGCSEEDKRTTAMIAGAILSDIQQLNQTGYQRPDWKAGDYFTDTKVIALCNAIQKRDLVLIDKLISEGADVNAKGKGNMTPLLWAFVQSRPWNRPPSLSRQNKPGVIEKWSSEEFDVVHLTIFTKLLKHGADPSVQFTVNFWKDRDPGSSVTETVIESAARKKFPYFESMMKNGLDPNWVSTDQKRYTLAHLVIGYNDAVKKLQLLIKAGVDLNQVDSDGNTPLMLAVRYNRFDAAILLVEAGADWEKLCSPNSLETILHALVKKEEECSNISAEQVTSYRKLIKILKEKGADFDEARKDIEWGNTNRPDFIPKSKIKYQQMVKERHERYQKMKREQQEQAVEE